MPFRPAIALSAGISALAIASIPTAAWAQREIVQSLPAPEAAQLNEALQRLARSPNDTAALIQAGEASLALGDGDAALGFFVRARDLTPNNPRAVAGLARSFLAQGRAVEALRFFAEAERAGAPAASIAADRGLATDLVGDNANAQDYYREALARNDTSETRRRLALSLAISGDRAEFEKTLLPLLQADDRPAFRTRAFGLAILGAGDEAVEIAEAMMPADLALRMAPYLRYMPRLTKAQQAAAANLGTFPRSGDIGRDSAEVAGYSPESIQVARAADASLTPSGAPMGSQAAAATPQAEETATRGRPDRQTIRYRPAPSSDPLSRTRSRTVRVERTAPEPVIASQTVAPPARQDPVKVAAAPSTSTGELPPAARDQSFDLANAQNSSAPASPVDEAVSSASTEPEVAGSVQEEKPATLADAFADFGLARAATPAAGAVDITSIEPPREVEEPAPPAHPARHWVQVATGRDRSALAFDWRRIERRSESILEGKGPFVTPWGVANRLLAGPFPSAAEARDTVNKLKGLGVDSFAFSSPEGQAIEKLD